jgi:hypothetical protein
MWTAHAARLLVMLGGAVAQQGSQQGDVRALVRFKAGCISPAGLETWMEGRPLCARPGWDSPQSGWFGVMCSQAGANGRATHLELEAVGDGGRLEDLAPLTELQVLALMPSSAVTGDIAALADMRNLRSLDLHGTNAYGLLDSLAGLVHLGESWTRPSGATVESHLYLAGTNVNGQTSLLLAALPSLASRIPPWGSSRLDYTACGSLSYDVYSACTGLGLAFVANADEIIGSDECGCCLKTAVDNAPFPRVRDTLSGECVPPDEVTVLPVETPAVTPAAEPEDTPATPVAEPKDPTPVAEPEPMPAGEDTSILGVSPDSPAADYLVCFAFSLSCGCISPNSTGNS